MHYRHTEDGVDVFPKKEEGLGAPQSASFGRAAIPCSSTVNRLLLLYYLSTDMREEKKRGGKKKETEDR